MAAVLEGIKVGVVRSAPRQHDLIGVVGISHLGIGGQGGSVGDTHGAVAIPALDAVGIHGGRLVDLAQAGLRHLDGHDVGGIIVSHRKCAGILGPCSDLVGAGGIAEKLDNHVLLVILNALGHGIDVSIPAERRRLGGDGGQGTDDLVVHGVTHGGGSGVGIAISNVGQAAVVLAGGVFALPHGLVQCGVAGLVLGVNGDIVVPCRAVNGGHGQGHEEGIAGAGDILRDASLHNEIQPLLHIRSGGVAGGIRFGHSHADVLHSRFQRIFHSGGIGSQGGGQLIVQQIAGKVVDAALGLVSVRGGQTEGGQHGVASLRAVETIQHAHLPLTVHDLIVHGDVSDAEVGELHALNGVLCQLVDNRVVVQAGGNVGFRIPRTLRAGSGDVVLVDGKGGVLCGVDGRFCERCGDEAQSHDGGHEHGQYAMDLFHVQLFSLFIIFELSFSLFTGILVVSIRRR